MISRRAVLLGGCGAAVAAGGGFAWSRTGGTEYIPLYSDTVAFASMTTRSLVPAGRKDLVVAGSRVSRFSTSSSALLARERSWLAAAPSWTRTGPWASMNRDALLDLLVLSADLPAPVAGWSDPWRYIWPRDASTVAVALAQCGHADVAVATMKYLASVQGSDGWFEARYDPATGKSPDDRARQLDGCGWVLWAVAQTAQVLTSSTRSEFLQSVDGMVRRSVTRILSSTNTSDHLPDGTPDYWEVAESVTTLGTVAMLAAGLEAAVSLGHADAKPRLEQLDAAIARNFAAYDYPRHPQSADPDVAAAFLLKPFRRNPDPAVLPALRKNLQFMQRANGGLAPGASWKRDGIGWTPETALIGMAALANGDSALGERMVRWVGDHRTPAGSYPEKVDAAGQPSAVAPLSWTAALVLLATYPHTPTG